MQDSPVADSTETDMSNSVSPFWVCLILGSSRCLHSQWMLSCDYKQAKPHFNHGNSPICENFIFLNWPVHDSFVACKHTPNDTDGKFRQTHACQIHAKRLYCWVQYW